MRTLLLSLLALAPALAEDESYSLDSPLNQRPMLGIEMTPPSQSVLEREGLSADQGVLIQDVYADTAAAAMGLQKGDVIVSINGMPIGSMQDLRNEVGLANVGDPLEVTVSRGGQQQSVGANAKPWPATIPYEKLDAEAEQRFRDWQDRRMERVKDDTTRLAAEAAALEKTLTEEPPRWYGSDGTDRNGNPLPSTPAWTLTWAVRSPEVTPAMAADPAPLPVLPSPGGTGPWVFQVQIDAPDAPL